MSNVVRLTCNQLFHLLSSSVHFRVRYRTLLPESYVCIRKTWRQLLIPSTPPYGTWALVSFPVQFVQSLLPRSSSGRLGLYKTVDDRIEEDSADADAAPEQFHEVEGLAEHESDANDNDDALGRVRHGLSHGVLRIIMVDSCEMTRGRNAECVIWQILVS